jgi:hypothetical protein
VVPGAADGVVDNEALADRAPVMRTLGTDCKKVLAASNEDHLLIADPAGHHGTVLNRG